MASSVVVVGTNSCLVEVLPSALIDYNVLSSGGCGVIVCRRHLRTNEHVALLHCLGLTEGLTLPQVN